MKKKQEVVGGVAEGERTEEGERGRGKKKSRGQGRDSHLDRRESSILALVSAQIEGLRLSASSFEFAEALASAPRCSGAMEDKGQRRAQRMLSIASLLLFFVAATADAKTSTRSSSRVPYSEPTPAEGGQVVRYNLTLGVAKRAPDCYREFVLFRKEGLTRKKVEPFSLSLRSTFIKKKPKKNSSRRLYDQRAVRRSDNRGPPRRCASCYSYQ